MDKNPPPFYSVGVAGRGTLQDTQGPDGKAKARQDIYPELSPQKQFAASAMIQVVNLIHDAGVLRSFAVRTKY